MELTLGPVLYEWKKSELLGFYDEVCDMDVDRVYVGEVVCARKRQFGGLSTDDIDRLARKLEAAGKKVVLSTLAVVSNEEELEATREVCALPYPVEANDMSVLNIVDPKTKDVTVGPHITTYNVPSMEFLSEIGVKRVVFPVELLGDTIRYNSGNTGVDCELFAHGKVPLAFSWRCYTARANGFDKTDCHYECVRYPEGMVLKSTEGGEVFTANGTSILSAGTYTLVEFIEDLKGTPIKALRISPQYKETASVVDIFQRCLKGSIDGAAALEVLKGICPGPLSNGWFMGGAGKDYIPGKMS
jgi:collagenase-like PrtC family protease